MAMVKFAHQKDSINQLMEAMKSNDENQIMEAWEGIHNSIAEQVKADFEELQQSNDAAVLAKRGYRQLTSKETKWYEKVIKALKSSEPKQAFTAIIGSDNEDDLMPTTIIEDVYKNLKEEHPLLQAINFQYVGYITKWILNDHTTQKAVWGKITAEIVKEITSSFKVIDVNQNKLSAYAIIENGMLDLGPVFLDGYIRAVLAEALYVGIEEAIVAGTGVDQPIGLIKDIHEGVAFSTETGYPDKEKVVVTSFAPAEYGPLLARFAKTEKGKKRRFTEVGLICNQNDYLTPSVTSRTPGQWPSIWASPTGLLISPPSSGRPSWIPLWPPMSGAPPPIPVWTATGASSSAPCSTRRWSWVRMPWPPGTTPGSSSPPAGGICSKRLSTPKRTRAMSCGC